MTYYSVNRKSRRELRWYHWPLIIAVWAWRARRDIPVEAYQMALGLAVASAIVWGCIRIVMCG